MNEDSGYHQHKVKCLHCGLHFIVCSWLANWPTHENKDAKLFCPECGGTGPYARWYEHITDGEIFQAVPGDSPLVDFTSEPTLTVDKEQRN